MNEEELVALVVRLTGNSVEYMKMLVNAQQATLQAQKIIESAGKKIEQISNSVKGFAGAAVSALAGFGLVGSLKGAFDKFSEHEAGVIRMNAAITAGGHSIETVMPQYKAFAEHLAEITTLSKGEVMGLLEMAESFGLSGKAAEDFVKQTIALATAGNVSNEVAARAVRGLMTGNTHMLRAIPQLREIHDEGQRVAKAQQLMGQGWQTNQQLAQTASGQLEKLGHAFSYISLEVGKIVSEWAKPFIDWLQMAFKWFKDLGPEAKEMAVKVALIGLSILSLGPAMTVLAPLIDMILAPFKLMVKLAGMAVGLVLQLAGVALWLAWAAAMTVVNFAVGTFNVIYTATKFLLLIGTGFWASTTGAMLATKVMAWLLNSALTVTNILMDAITAVAISVALLGTAVVLGLVAAAAWGVWTALSSVYEALTTLRSQAGIVGHFGDLFNEWGGILKDLVTAFETDLPLAMQLSQAAFALGVSQIKDLWPPLWAFIKRGFAAVMDVVVAGFEKGFKDALRRMLTTMTSWWMYLIAPGVSAAAMAGLAAIGDTEAALRTALANAEDELRRSAGVFGAEESERTRTLRAEVQRIRDELANVVANPKKKPSEQDPIPQIGVQAHKTAKELHNLRGMLVGSAEDIAALAEYRDRMRPTATGSLAPAAPSATTSTASNQPVAVRQVGAGGGADDRTREWQANMLTTSRATNTILSDIRSNGGAQPAGVG